MVGGVQRKLGLDAATLRAGRKRLIHVSLTGFGMAGPYAAHPCYDLIAEGYSSVMDLTGPSDAEPQKSAPPPPTCSPAPTPRWRCWPRCTAATPPARAAPSTSR